MLKTCVGDHFWTPTGQEWSLPVPVTGWALRKMHLETKVKKRKANEHASPLGLLESGSSLARAGPGIGLPILLCGKDCLPEQVVKPFLRLCSKPYAGGCGPRHIPALKLLMGRESTSVAWKTREGGPDDATGMRACGSLGF